MKKFAAGLCALVLTATSMSAFGESDKSKLDGRLTDASAGDPRDYGDTR